MELQQWLNETPIGEFCFTILVSMLPVVELRGGIPYGTQLHFSFPGALVHLFNKETEENLI